MTNFWLASRRLCRCKSNARSCLGSRWSELAASQRQPLRHERRHRLACAGDGPRQRQACAHLAAAPRHGGGDAFMARAAAAAGAQLSRDRNRPAGPWVYTNAGAAAALADGHVGRHRATAARARRDTRHRRRSFGRRGNISADVLGWAHRAEIAGQLERRIFAVRRHCRPCVFAVGKTARRQSRGAAAVRVAGRQHRRDRALAARYRLIDRSGGRVALSPAGPQPGACRGGLTNDVELAVGAAGARSAEAANETVACRRRQ